MDHLCYLCLVFDLLSRLISWLSFGMFNCVFVTFPCGIWGQLWYLIVSFPRRYFFCGSFVLFMSCVGHAFASVHK